MEKFTKKKIEEHFCINPQVKIPRSIGIIKNMLQESFNPKTDFDAEWLYEFCKDKAGVNGKNAFLRAMLMLQKEYQNAQKMSDYEKICKMLEDIQKTKKANV